MDAPEQNLCLINMPVLVLEKILANIHNPSNVTRTCKYLYEIVCGMGKHRCAMHITAFDATSPLNIDADAVFDSIMNSHRTITQMELRLTMVQFWYQLNERQLERLTAIMKQFGANVTSLKFHGFVLAINFILELMQQAPKLKSLLFTWGAVNGSVAESKTMSLQLPSLKVLEIDDFGGHLHVINVGLAGLQNINSSILGYFDQTTEVLTTFLTKQHTIKSLTLKVLSNSDLTALRVDHLQLETLAFRWYALDISIQFGEILKCQTNLKELRVINYNYELSGSIFQWICNNLKKLEVFEVYRIASISIEGNALKMLGGLTQLRHFRTYDAHYLFDNGFQSSQFNSDSIEKFEFGYYPNFGFGDLLTKVVNSMAHNLPNLTHLRMRFENFSALCFVLRHCTKITHLTSYISDPNTDQLTQHRFPNIQSLDLCHDGNYYDASDETMSQSMTSIVHFARAMPNLRSMSLSTQSGLKFDVKTMKEFIKESKSLEYFYVDWFELQRELSADNVVETIRCLLDQLKEYHIIFTPSISLEGLNWHKIRKILSNELSVRNDCWKRPSFYLHKGVEKKFHSKYFLTNFLCGFNKTF